MIDNSNRNLDSFDFALLRELQQDSQQSSTVLAQKIALSPSAIQRRIKRLRLLGVIQSEHAIIKASAIGSFLRLLVMVRLKRGGADINAVFQASLKSLVEVQQCYAVTGEFDYALMLVVRDMEDFDHFSKHIFQRSKEVDRFETTVILETIHQSLTLPI